MAVKRKLQEDFAHMAGIGDLQCHPNGIHVYTGGADAAIRVFSHADQFRLVSDLSNHHTHPVRCLAFSPSGDTLASAADDAKVQLFNIPPSTASSFSPPKFESTLHRSSHGPVLSLCYHPSSLQLALGCSDGVLRLVSVLDNSQVREVKGHAGSVRHVCYDPSGSVLASIDHLGVLMLTRHEDRSCLLMETVMQRSDTGSSRQQCRCAFSPDSQLLALPGKKDVSIRSREAGWRREQEAMRLKGGHEHDVSIVAWSGSGRYLLSASAGRVVVWEAESGEMLSSCQLEDDVSSNSVQWSVRENSIVVMDENGYVKKWQQPVPAHMPPPFKQEDADVEREMDRREAAEAAERAGDGSGEQAVDTSQLQPVGDSDEDDDDGGKAEKKDSKKTEAGDDDEQAAQHRKRLRRAGEAAAARAGGGGGDGGDGDGAMDEQEDDDMDGFIVDDTDGLYKDTDDDYLSRKARQSLTGSSHGQPPFQPSSTPLDPTTSRRYLCFNLIGSVVSQAGPAFNSLEIVFSDSAQHKAIRLRDHYGFSMAALGQHGCVMASRWTSTAKPSVVFYRAFDSWAANSDWTLHLPSPETALCVAVGAKFVAVGTDRQFVRLMSYSGLQLSVWSLRGPVVSMVAQAQLLCVVYHTAMPLPSHQCLAVLVMDVERRQRLLDGPLPISPGSSLTWLGYSDRSALLTMDSAGVVRVLSDQWGGQWVPVLDVGAAAGRGTREAHWPVGLMDDRLMCCVCKGGLKVPNTVNRPVLSAVPLRLPFLQTETVQQEEQHARQDLLLYQQHRHRHQTAAAGSSSLPFTYNPTPKEQASLDKLLLPLVQLACKADAGSRAVDVASRLGLLRSMELCLTLANSSRKVALSSRIALMIAARRKEKEEEKERERRRSAAGEGAAISIEGFMEKGEKRADEDRKRRQERLRQEEDALRSSSSSGAQAAGDAQQEDGGDEGETELTYSRKGKKRVKIVERSEVDRQREEQQREEREDREAQEERTRKREAEAKAAQQLVEEDDEVAVTGQSEGGSSGKAVDFLTQFKRQKEREAAEKERQRREQQEKEKQTAKQQQKKKTAAAKKAKGEKGDKDSNQKTAAGKGKGKENEKDKTSREAASEGEREKDSESQKDEDAAVGGGGAAAALISKPKPVNPFAKRTFADIAASS